MTTLERALLGLLAMQPGSGYDLVRTFETTSMGHFSGSPGAIYPALERLATRGYLTSRFDPKSTRPRKIFTLTAAGHDALEAWLKEPITARQVRDELDVLLLRFSVSETHLGPRESIAMLSDLRDAVTKRLQFVTKELRTLRPDPFLNPLLALEHGRSTLRATLRWIDRSIERLEAGASRQEGGEPLNRGLDHVHPD